MKRLVLAAVLLLPLPALAQAWPVTSKLVLCLGDSLTEQPIGTAYPYSLGVRLGAGWTVTNVGRGGTRTDEIRDNWIKDTIWNVLPYAYQRPQYLIIMGGHNDFAQGVATAVSLKNIQLTVAEVKRLGGTPVVATVTTRLNSTFYTPEGEVLRLAFNAALQSWAASSGTIIVDVAADFLDGGTGALKAAYDSGDHVHWNQAGGDRFAVLVRAALGL